MRKRTAALLFLLVCGMTAPVFAGANHYDIQLQLDHVTRQLRATSVISFRAPAAASSIRFLLNKSLIVTRVKCGACKGFRFATGEPSPYRYMADGAPLQIALKRPAREGELLKIFIAYSGTLTAPRSGVNVFTADYAELAHYIGWFPFMPEMGKFSYDVIVSSADPAYTVTGEGAITGVGSGRWRLVEPNETFDIPVVSARGLKTKSLRNGELQVVYPDSIDDAVPAEVIREMDETMKSLTEWFGPAACGRLRLLLNQRRGGGSYVRPGFVSLMYAGGSYSALRRSMVATLGHELSHLWWTGAPVVTWEDWLNESFAEYSAWLRVKQVFGTAEYDKQVAAVRDRAKAKPPIWGIDRNADDAYFVLYDKGALLLHDLATRIGENSFLMVAKEAARTPPRTTAAFLARLERATSPEVRRDFESALKQ